MYIYIYMYIHVHTPIKVSIYGEWFKGGGFKESSLRPEDHHLGDRQGRGEGRGKG